MTDLETYMSNVKHLSDMVARIGSHVSDKCGLGPPKIFDGIGGKSRVWKLHERATVSIVKAHLEPNTIFPAHAHEAIEIIILFEGSARFTAAGITEDLVLGKPFEVPPELEHSVESGKDGAWFSVTTVPREPGLVP